MKQFIFGLALFILLACGINANAQTDTTNGSNGTDRLRYYKEKYEENYNAPFETVWSAIKENIKAIGANVLQQKYSQDEAGLYKGTIKSDNYVFTSGLDSTYQVLQRYHKDMPYIPGSKWANGRINYKIIVKEIEQNKISITMTSEMSGFESYVTSQIYFWKSNGLLEKDFLDKLKALIEKNK